MNIYILCGLIAIIIRFMVTTTYRIVRYLYRDIKKINEEIRKLDKMIEKLDRDLN